MIFRKILAKERGGQWIKKVNCRYGPLLIAKEEIKDLSNINLYLDLNGEGKLEIPIK